MTQYIFTSLYGRDETISFLSNLPNHQNSGYSSGRTVITNFNHTTQQQIDDFCNILAENGITIVKIDGVETNLIQKFNFLRTDHLLFSITPRLQINNIPTTYTDLFPSLYQGFPIPIHTIGYTKMGFVLLWNKNSGTGVHDLRLIKCDNSGNLLPNPSTPDILIEGLNIPSGRTTNFDFNIPSSFLDFRGFVKLQGKSTVNTDDPILDAMFVYIIR